MAHAIFFRSAAILKVLVRPNWFSNLSEPWVKESRYANFGAIQAIFLQLSWSQHKLAHSCQGRTDAFNYMSYHFLCKRGIRPARTEQFLVWTLDDPPPLTINGIWPNDIWLNRYSIFSPFINSVIYYILTKIIMTSYHYQTQHNVIFFILYKF